MSSARPRTKSGNGWLAAALAIVACVLLLWLWADPVAPPPRDDAALGDSSVGLADLELDGGPELESGRGPASTSGRQAARLSADAARPGAYGRLLDNRGEPLAGFDLRLGDALWALGGGVPTRADGSFAFPLSSPGDYRLLTSPFGFVNRKFHLDEGQRLKLDVRLPDNMVAVTARVQRRGELQTGLALWCHDGDDWRRQASESDGIYRMVLPAGPQTVGLSSPEVQLHHGEPCYQQVVAVPRGEPRCDCTITLLCSDLVVFVLDERGQVPKGAKVTVHGKKHDTKLNKWAQPVAKQGARFSFLPPGEYRVSVDGDDLAAGPAQSVVVPQQEGSLRLQFEVARAVSLRLELHSNGDLLRLVEPDCMPVLRSGSREWRFGPLTGSWGRYHLRASGFADVLPGRATLHGEDQVRAGEVWFLAFDPIEDQFADVVLGQDNLLRCQVQRRASVDLRACEANGREQFDATIQVFAGELRVRSLAVKGQQRFLSFLPPGGYRVVVDRAGKPREHTLVVARQDVQLRLRP